MNRVFSLTDTDCVTGASAEGVLPLPPLSHIGSLPHHCQQQQQEAQLPHPPSPPSSHAGSSLSLLVTTLPSHLLSLHCNHQLHNCLRQLGFSWELFPSIDSRVQASATRLQAPLSRLQTPLSRLQTLRFQSGSWARPLRSRCKPVNIRSPARAFL